MNLPGTKLATIAVLVLSCVLALSCSNQKQTDGKQAGTTSDTLTSPAPKDSLTVELTGMDSLSVFELLQKSHKVSYHPTAIGVFVTGIDSIASDSRHYWVYSVNDSFPQIASDKYLTGRGDRVVWHYRNTQ